MSSEEPEIVLNEFGDLSRKARRELEAKGIDPDTAVMEFKIATGHIPIISEEQAAAAKIAQTEVESTVAAPQVPSAPAVVQPPSSHSVPTPSMPPIPVIPNTRLTQPAVEEPTQKPEPAQAEVVEEIIAEVQPGFPRVDSTFVSANTGPIEPLDVQPALDDSSLAAVEQTLAAASDIPSQSAFDDVISTTEEDVLDIPDSGKPQKLTRKEKKALARQEKAAKAAASHSEENTQDLPNIVEDAAPAITAIAVTEVIAAEETAPESTEEIIEDTVVPENAEAEVEEDSVVLEVSEGLTVIYEDEADSPQTISEVTAAIAVAEAVAAAEAAVEAGEVVMDFDSMSGVPTTTGSIPVISNALIIPTLPETTGQISPITQTGEVVITGSILIPPSVSQLGANVEQLDTSEIDIIADDQEIQTTSTNMAPVSAAAAVSAYDIANSVITKPKGMNERLPFILSIAAAALAVGVVAILVIGYINGIF